jgi:hypothetical protein
MLEGFAGSFLHPAKTRAAANTIAEMIMTLRAAVSEFLCILCTLSSICASESRILS